jgi:hypothetical protein
MWALFVEAVFPHAANRSTGRRIEEGFMVLGTVAYATYRALCWPGLPLEPVHWAIGTGYKGPIFSPKKSSALKPVQDHASPGNDT